MCVSLSTWEDSDANVPIAPSASMFDFLDSDSVSKGFLESQAHVEVPADAVRSRYSSLSRTRRSPIEGE